MTPIRVGAVEYLNARPLVQGLERHAARFVVRYDVPSRCATLLHDSAIDVGMIPSIEYLRGADYRIVPDVGVISDGPVASVALFSTKPVEQIRSIAGDISSRTSTGLLRVLSAERFGIDATVTPMPPDPAAMLRECDAALVIGDAALFFDHEAAGALKVDLGEEWTALTGLPFVWAFWAGRIGVLHPPDVAVLIEARDAGVAAADAIADVYCGPERAAVGRAYLRENIQYTLDERAQSGLRTYFELAARHGVVDAPRAPAFYHR